MGPFSPAVFLFFATLATMGLVGPYSSSHDAAGRSNQIIRGQKSWNTYLRAFLVVIGAMFLAASAFLGLQKNLTDFRAWIGIVLVAFLLLWVIDNVFLLRVEVSSLRLCIRSSSGKIDVETRCIEAIEFLERDSNSHYLGLRISDLKNRTGTSLNPKLFANGDELVKAIIEATWRNNPEVKIDWSLIRRYGQPSYGIFGSIDDRRKFKE